MSQEHGFRRKMRRVYSVQHTFSLPKKAESQHEEPEILEALKAVDPEDDQNQEDRNQGDQKDPYGSSLSDSLKEFKQMVLANISQLAGVSKILDQAFVKTVTDKVSKTKTFAELPALIARINLHAVGQARTETGIHAANMIYERFMQVCEMNMRIETTYYHRVETSKKFAALMELAERIIKPINSDSSNPESSNTESSKESSESDSDSSWVDRPLYEPDSYKKYGSIVEEALDCIEDYDKQAADKLRALLSKKV